MTSPSLLALPPHPTHLPWPTDSWPRADLDPRVDRAALARLLDHAFGATEPDDLERTNAVVVVQHGAIVAERYRRDVGILKRDLGREPPNTQTGLRLRSIFSREIGPSKALLQGELWNNYFFLTKQDTAGDLRLEGDFNVKLRVPIRRYLSVAPYLDFYWFQLKTRRTTGYTTTLGVSIGFSRLWKPQYEDF